MGHATWFQVTIDLNWMPLPYPSNCTNVLVFSNHDSDYRSRLQSRMKICLVARLCTGGPWLCMPNSCLCWLVVFYACYLHKKSKRKSSSLNYTQFEATGKNAIAVVWSYYPCLSRPCRNCCRMNCCHWYHRHVHCLLELPRHSKHSSATSPLHHCLEPDLARICQELEQSTTLQWRVPQKLHMSALSSKLIKIRKLCGMSGFLKSKHKPLRLG